MKPVDAQFPMTSPQVQLQHRVPPALDGRRFDQVAAELFSGFSRERLKAWIQTGELRLDGVPAKPNSRVREGQLLVLEGVLPTATLDDPEDLPLDIVYEDEHLLVIDKPAGLVVHPAAGHPGGTLVNALLHRYPDAALLPRAGIVHRLDKDTTGLMVVARTVAAHQLLVGALQQRTVKREYAAVVCGLPTGGGKVDLPLGRHPRLRQKQAVLAHGGKPAVTHYRIQERFAAHALLAVQLETGRTHQIRVHMSHIGFPLIGDPVYGGRLRLPKAADAELTAVLSGFPRQALHACRLGLQHPATGKAMSWDSALPVDMQALLQALRTHRDAAA